MPALKHSHDYIEDDYTKEQKAPKKSYATAPIKQKSRVTSKLNNVNSQAAIEYKATTLNFALLTFGGILTLAFIAIYSFVAFSETRLANLHTKISELNYENTELENKLENIKSYYAVDSKVSATNDFDKAKNVIEVNQVAAKPIKHIEPKNNNLNTVTGF